MFPSKKHIREAVNRLWTILEPMQRGDVLAHGQIQEILGFAPHEGCWDRVIDKLRDRSEDERGISLVSDITIGYRLATTDEQLRLGPLRTKQALRRIRKGKKSVDSLLDDDLTFHQRRVKYAMSDKLAATEATLRRETQLHSFLLRPRETMPRIAVRTLDATGQTEDQAESA